jgi:hypothetical protein
MKKQYFIYLLVLLVLFCIYRLINKYKNNLYLNSLETLKYRNSYILNNGPYILKNGTKIYEYNPSIYQTTNGDIISAVRLTGHYSNERHNKCNILLKKYTYNRNVEDNFSIFPEPIVKKCSHSIIRNHKTNEVKFVPYMDKNIKDIEDILSKFLGNEDPRLFTFNNKDWVYYHYLGRSTLNKNKCSINITISPLNNLENSIILYTDNQKKIEKNWMPFEFNNELYFEYSIHPRVILKAELDNNKIPTGYCPKVYKTNYKNILKNRHFGCGSPCIKIKLNGKYYFIGIAHTRGKVKFITVRKNFFYIFRAEPPFDILWCSPEINMLNSNILIDFATSLIVKNSKNSDKIEDYTIFVSFGVEDCYGVVNEYNLTDILNLNNNELSFLS